MDWSEPFIGYQYLHIWTASIYSVIAEKFEAFVSLGLANSRYKDFYDIYILANKHDMDGIELKNAIAATFSHRGTGLDDIAAFESGFTKDPVHQSRWKAFTKKKKALVQADFEEVITLVKTLLIPITEAIKLGSLFNKKWDKDSKSWG